MFDTGRKQWVRFDRWPAPNAVKRFYYFHADGSLTPTAPTASHVSLEYPSDPLKPVPSRCVEPTIEGLTLYHYMSDDQRCFTSRPDVLVFQTDTLREDVTLAVNHRSAQVSMSASDADFVVKLIDVYPPDTPDSPYQPDTGVHMGGYQQLVRGEIMRGRFRKSFAAPEPFTPNAVTSVAFRLQDILHTFKKGHRIMVQVQSSWFPAFDRIETSEHRGEGERYQGTGVWVGREAASGIEVQVLPPQ
jgi:putative CocE/NonD family hydrolase